MWDAASGTKQYTFEGHEAPVYSVCPHYKENIQVEIDLLTPLRRMLFEFVCMNEYDPEETFSSE